MRPVKRVGCVHPESGQRLPQPPAAMPNQNQAGEIGQRFSFQHAQGSQRHPLAGLPFLLEVNPPLAVKSSL
jgi:hypothetical protein